jgi:hypothetical protein
MILRLMRHAILRDIYACFLDPTHYFWTTAPEAGSFASSETSNNRSNTNDFGSFEIEFNSFDGGYK